VKIKDGLSQGRFLRNDPTSFYIDFLLKIIPRNDVPELCQLPVASCQKLAARS